MKIKQIKIKNFKSIGGKIVTINLQDNGLHLIRGISGVGKTLLLSAITFGLFGKSSDFKGSSKTTIPLNNLINDINKKELLVELELDNGYVIKRGLKPNIFEIIKDGKDLAEYSSKTIDQEFLEKNVLNEMNIDVFLNTIYLSNKPASVPFVYMSNTQRKEYIEKILDLTIIQFLNDNLKIKISANKMEINSLETEKRINKEYLEKEKDKYELELSEYESNLEKRKRQETETKETLQQIEQDILKLQNKKQEIQSEIESLEKQNKITEEEFINNNTLIENLQIQKDEELSFNKEKLKQLSTQDYSLYEEKIKNKSNDIEYLEKTTMESLNKKFDNSLLEKVYISLQEKMELKNSLIEKSDKAKALKQKLEMELETFLSNKSRYGNCGDCSKLSYIIGSFDVDETKQKIEKLKNALEDFQQKLNTLDNSLNELIVEKQNLENKKSEFEKLLKEESLNLASIELKKNELKLLKEELESKKNRNSVELNELKKVLKEIEHKYKEKISNLYKEYINDINQKIKDKESSITLLDEKVNSLKDKEMYLRKVQDNQPELKKPDKKYLEEMEKKSDITNKNYDIEYNKSVELDELKKNINSKDHKTAALNSILPIFEKKLNRIIEGFMQDDEFKIVTKLTNDFELTFLKNGKEVSLFSLSSGQQQAISLATTFGFLYILSLKHSNNVSLLLIDEILDMSLGTRGKYVIEYLKEISTVTPVYVISHNQSLDLEMFESVTNVRKIGNFSVYEKE